MPEDTTKCPWCEAAYKHRNKSFAYWSCGSYDDWEFGMKRQVGGCRIRQLEAQVAQLTKERDHWKFCNSVNSAMKIEAQGHCLTEGTMGKGMYPVQAGDDTERPPPPQGSGGPGRD